VIAEENPMLGACYQFEGVVSAAKLGPVTVAKD
jgi:hypothetical protein